MSLRRTTAALLVVVSFPVCAAVAGAAVLGADCLLAEAVPPARGKRGLFVGLMGIWGLVLFVFLMGQIAWLSDWIDGCSEPSVPSAPDHRTTAVPRYANAPGAIPGIGTVGSVNGRPGCQGGVGGLSRTE
jgi:hypothetical protein